MIAEHGELLMQKPINEYAIYLKNLIPAIIPTNYTLKPMFHSVAIEEDIRKGVIAFRDFLFVLCERLITDGYLFVKPQKTKNLADYPFLHYVNHLLIDIGYYSKLSENSDSLLIEEIPSFISSKSKIPASKQIECLRFLELCGFVFSGIELKEKKLELSKPQLIEVSYPNNPIMLTGLKALSIADIELRPRRYKNDDYLLRCDYRLLKADDSDMFDVLKDFVHPLPIEIQKFALELHHRYIDKGMTCVTINDDAVHFSYSYIKNSKRELSYREIYQQRIWEFALSVKYGYCLLVRTKKTDKYADVIAKFPLSIQRKIAQGYGCDRKLRNERCQGGCQGIRLPLDDSILENKHDIELWLDNELYFQNSKSFMK